jgi:type I restriction enzyme M protein
MNSFIKRSTILESIGANSNRNIYCEKKSLTNEASVETFFINRMLVDLGYKDENIKPKESIEKFKVLKGSKKTHYKPDYIIAQNNIPYLVIDAKAPNEKIENWIEQCAHYCLILNRSAKTVKYFLLSNGIKTSLYKWDEQICLIELDFEDFQLSNIKYEHLRKILLLQELTTQESSIKEERKQNVVLKKINKEDAQKLFKNCHKYIWNTDDRGVNSAFIEFIKLIFLKLWNDKKLHENHKVDDFGNLKVPLSENVFSVSWIESRENDLINPINDIQFRDLMNLIQDDVDKNNKKPIFNVNEKIELKPTTIKGVIKKLETVDLFGIDEDLNGRLFETFLNATMRGSSLGQYFTPRSIVLLGASLANLQVDKKHIDKILDASCGTAGFLIEALTIMRNKVRNNQSYIQQEKIDLIKKITKESIFGIDSAKDPNLSRIARINMYLHGDGGSHIYFGDGLAKNIEIDKSDERQIQLETEDMKNNIIPNSFDIVLTNPPFSKWYENNNEAQKNVLKDYELIKIIGVNKQKNRLRSSVMFIERYRDLLKIGGKLISIIDDTVLSSKENKNIRKFIRDNFIIRAIISLHGDAFQMASARVKTALIYLEKKKNSNDKQPAVFMYSSIYLGVDDMPVTTKPSKIMEARKMAKEEIDKILNEYNRFKNGEKDIWFVDPEKINDRLDVKYCINLSGRYILKWEKSGYEIKTLSQLCNQRNEIIKPSEDYPDEEFKILTITYSGRCRTDETRLGEEINYKKMKIVRNGDIVFSEYNTIYGAIGYITEDFDGALASGSYTVVRCFNSENSLYLWSILRTTEIRSDFLSSAIGLGRTTIDWKDIKNVKIPLLPLNERKEISKKILDSWIAEKKSKNVISNINNLLHEKFDVESEESKIRFLGAKPPK